MYNVFFSPSCFHGFSVSGKGKGKGQGLRIKKMGFDKTSGEQKIKQLSLKQADFQVFLDV